MHPSRCHTCRPLLQRNSSRMCVQARRSFRFNRDALTSLSTQWNKREKSLARKGGLDFLFFSPGFFSFFFFLNHTAHGCANILVFPGRHRRGYREEFRVYLITSAIDLFPPIIERWRDSKDRCIFILYSARAVCSALVCSPLTDRSVDDFMRQPRGKITDETPLCRGVVSSSQRRVASRTARRCTRAARRGDRQCRGASLPTIKLEDKARSREN